MQKRTEDRTVLKISGQDAYKFLNDLITNTLSKDKLVYAALLTPQGKYLFDFFVLHKAEGWFLDVHAMCADDLIKRLLMYRLRADVMIEKTDLSVQRGLDNPPKGAYLDPRHSAMGWRLYADAPGQSADIDWAAIRVDHCIPETGIELISDATYILEAGFERLNGVDFQKGCYVGQEVTARMKHKTELRKGLAIIVVYGQAPIGSVITTSGGKPVGTLYTQSGGRGIAYLRFDRVKDALQAGGVDVIFEE